MIKIRPYEWGGRTYKYIVRYDGEDKGVHKYLFDGSVIHSRDWVYADWCKPPGPLCVGFYTEEDAFNFWKLHGIGRI
jgi:hypothetical protein